MAAAGRNYARLAPLAILLLSGCARTAHRRDRLHPLLGLVPSLEFTLQDASTGRSTSAADFRGKVLLLYFGYSHCPDVCPTTLTKLAAAVRALDPAARREVRILFVTVDPARDSAAALRAYAAAFGPEVVGQRGSKAQIDRLAARDPVAYSFGAPDAKGDYDVTHSSAVFVFDRDGRARSIAEPDDGVAAISADLRALLGRS